MRIGIDGSCWNNNRGFGRFTRELLVELCAIEAGHSYHVLADGPIPPETLGPLATVHPVATSKPVVEAAKADSRRGVVDLLRFRRVASGLDLDLLFYPAVYSWFPPPRGLPTAVTFHDAIAEHFPELVFPSRKHRWMWNAKTWAARRLASRIITVSHAAKAEIVEFMGIPEDRIDVICEGAPAVFAPVTSSDKRAAVRRACDLPLDARLIVYVGGFAPHKNLRRLLEGFAATEPGTDDLHLVMVGDPEGGGFYSNYEELRARARKPDLASRVHFPGYLEDADLAVLFSDALALALPSLSEGFGLPALEAMQCGTPVLAASGGAVAEVAGAAGLGFDPLDVSDIAATLTRIATEPGLAARLAAACAGEVPRNTWPRAAELTLASLERMMAERG